MLRTRGPVAPLGSSRRERNAPGHQSTAAARGGPARFGDPRDTFQHDMATAEEGGESPVTTESWRPGLPDLYADASRTARASAGGPAPRRSELGRTEAERRQARSACGTSGQAARAGRSTLGEWVSGAGTPSSRPAASRAGSRSQPIGGPLSVCGPASAQFRPPAGAQHQLPGVDGGRPSGRRASVARASSRSRASRRMRWSM